MERIKRALELARAERNHAIERAHATERVSAAAAADRTDRALRSERGFAAERGQPFPDGENVILGASSDADDRGHIDTAVLFARTRVAPVNDAAIRKNRLLLPGVVGEAAHSYKMLRTQVLQRLAQRGWNTLAVVSPTPGDGKTFTAINLAVAISGDTNYTALLVDLDLRQPSIHTRFGMAPGPGVERCLRGEIDVSRVLVNPAGYERLLLLPGNEPVRNSSELLSSESARRTIREIKERYRNRIVLFDLPPVLGADDALSFVPQVDAALVVVRDGQTKSDDLVRLFEILKNVPVVGTVLNGARTDPAAAYAY